MGAVVALRGRPPVVTEEDRALDRIAEKAETADVIRLSAYLYRTLPIGTPQRTAAARITSILERQQRNGGDAA